MTTSSHPFGFHMPGPMPAPVPLHQAPAAQPAPAVPPAFTGTVPLARREPLPVCVTCGARRGPLVPSGDCYDSGAPKFICASRDCTPGPLEPAMLTGRAVTGGADELRRAAVVAVAARDEGTAAGAAGHAHRQRLPAGERDRAGEGRRYGRGGLRGRGLVQRDRGRHRAGHVEPERMGRCGHGDLDSSVG
ncbi:hypothetical protein [Streptomyces scabiei]|uniref:hypothetical protein n=1 Tax=Streptomyces scabiei TaxID=1930 RepID=UPI0029A60408|nr:hypothetical protein [Streptomyces scabiei]MDX2863256.1 hypothetical protein [Streptomyces scabiei]